MHEVVLLLSSESRLMVGQSLATKYLENHRSITMLSINNLNCKYL